MRRLILATAFVSSVAGPAFGEGAQQYSGTEVPAGAPQARAADETASLAGATLLAGAMEASAPTQLAQAPAVRRPAPTRRRRGSMVGYIDDSTVESKVRVRVDSGYHITAPDRAEFFYAKCGCHSSALPPTHPLFDADAPGPGPGIATDLNSQQLIIDGEYLLGSRVSIFGVVPFRWLQPQSFVPGFGTFPNQGGTGDLRAGAKLGLADTATTGVTAKLQFYFPTGDSEKGLGTNHATFEPALLLHNSLSSIVELESQIGVWLPIGGSASAPIAAEGKYAGSVFYYGIGPSFTVYDRNNVRFAPVMELVGWHVLSGYETVAVEASGTNIFNLKIGGRLEFDQGSVYVGYGHALTDKVWYEDILRFEYRLSF